MRKSSTNRYAMRAVIFTMATLALIACSDDSGSSASELISESIESTDSDLVVKIFDDLPVCSDKRKGVTAYVKDEKIAYVCEDGDWTPDSAEDRDDSSRLSSPKAFSSNSGKASSSNQKTKSSSSNNKAESSSSVKAVSSSSKGKTNSSSSGKVASSSSFKYEQDSSADVQPKVIAIKNKSISGLSQKGPFVTGSTVKLYELELDGKTIVQTGKSFSGKITSDDGKFSFPSVTLASQYALLEATGYFRNEFTGKKSKGTITLNALTDLSDRKNVNINLLTHLEYERVLLLIESGISFAAAKKQAEAEILNAFGFKGEFTNSEDLDIFEKGDDNAALLALSVLILGGNYHDEELSEAELTERLTKLATDIAKDGFLDDEKNKAELAYNAMVYTGLEYRRFRTALRGNMEKWGLGGSIPDFEKYLRNYWLSNYGINNCESSNEGELDSIKGLYNNRFEHKKIICKSGVWGIATDLDIDSYKAKIPEKTEDGEFWIGSVTGRLYKYSQNNIGYVKDYDVWMSQNNGGWVFADEGEAELNIGGCTQTRFEEVAKADNGRYYVCRNNDIVFFDCNIQCPNDDGCYCLTGNFSWKELDEWSWLVPKEVRLNPEITYGTMTDERDKKVYKTVKIGDQVWMAENLNYADSTKTLSLLNRNWCYGDKESNCVLGGRLYTWAAAIDSVALYDGGIGVDCGYGKTCTLPTMIQGICPKGWHLPHREEWKMLFSTVGGESTAGKILKSQTCWSSGESSDAYGFSGLPAGYRDRNGYYDGERGNAYFWSSSEDDSDVAYSMRLRGDVIYTYQGCDYKNSGFSVRCIQD